MNIEFAGPPRAEVERILRERGHEFQRLHFTPGTNPHVTAEQVADEIERGLASLVPPQLAVGD
jgi:hypothetical protein